MFLSNRNGFTGRVFGVTLAESLSVASAEVIVQSELVSFGAPWARLDGVLATGGRTVKIVEQENGLIKKEFIINDQKLSRLSLNKTVPVVLFEPNHLQLLHGSPEARRDYLDLLLDQTVPGYSSLRREYKRTLAQRNALLKHGAVQDLFAWNIRLSQSGARVARERSRLVNELKDGVYELYHEISGSPKTTISLQYAASCDIHQYESILLQTLEKRQAIDIERGFTGAGPHREDLIVEFDNRPASEVASRGETRTVLLTLKIMELKLVEQARGQKPLLLLDDVFSELDGARRKALTAVIKGYQTFITTTDADVVVHHFIDNCNIIPLG